MSHSTIFIVVFIYWVEVDAILVSILVPLGSTTDYLVWWYAGRRRSESELLTPYLLESRVS